MWTNIFKIGGLHQLSWFQFLPDDFEFNTLPDKSVIC
ncbi:mediator complex subunit Srb9 [Orobanche minor]